MQRVFFGPLREPATDHPVQDLCWREIGALTPLAVLAFWIGIYPNYFLQPMAPALGRSTRMAARTVIQQDEIDAAAQPGMPLIRTAAPPAELSEGVASVPQGGLGL